MANCDFCDDPTVVANILTPMGDIAGSICITCQGYLETCMVDPNPETKIASLVAYSISKFIATNYGPFSDSSALSNQMVEDLSQRYKITLLPLVRAIVSSNLKLDCI